MTTLYQVAQMNNGLVVGTGNKVEDFGIGFYTKYGDGGVDISPIADCYKTQVWEMGRNLGILKEIINAALSARERAAGNPGLQQKLEIIVQMVKEMGVNPLGGPEEPTKRYLGMSVRWLKKRGWKWSYERGDFQKKGKLLKPHVERMKKRKKAKKPKQELPAGFKKGDEGTARPFDEMPD